MLCTSHLCGQNVWMNPNYGQWDDRIIYSIDVQMGRMFIEDNGMTYYFSDALKHANKKPKEEHHVTKYHSIKQLFFNSSWNGFHEKTDSSKHYNNYILGKDSSKWKSHVRAYKNVTLNDFAPNINLFYKSKNNSLLYGFKVFPGGETEDLKFTFKGSEKVQIDRNGNLHISHRFGEIIQEAPIAWTQQGEIKTNVAVLFEINNDTISFVFPEGYDQNQTLIIDPNLTFSTFSGSTADNWGFTATPDINANLFGGGIVFGFGYPTTIGAYDVSFNGGIGTFPTDIGITKFSSNGASLIYSTYLGGTGNETPHSLIANDIGELFIYGITCSDDFPMAGMPYDNSYNGGPFVIENSLSFDGSDIYVARLKTDGSGLVASTYIGGSDIDGLNVSSSLKYNYGDQFRGEISLDDMGNVYVSSTTYSNNFPTSNAAQASLNGIQDAVLIKLPPSLNTLTWSTFFGGNQEETGNSVAISSTDYIYLAGGTNSNTLPMSSGIDLSFNGGLSDGYIAKFNKLTGVLEAGTFMGLNEYDQTYFVQLDINDDVYVYGQTESAWAISPGCYGTPNSGQFIRKYNSDLTSIFWTTMIGAGSGHVEISPTAFLVSDCFDIYLAGWGGSLNSSLSQALFSSTNGFTPSTTPPNVGYQLSTNGSNFYVAVLDQDAASLKYATFMGGLTSSSNHVDGGTSRFDKSGRIYHSVCGGCGGNPTGFTSTPGSWSQFNQSSNCNMATFKFELSSIDAVVPAVAPLICIPQPVVFQNSSTNGNTYLWDFGDGNTSTDFSPTHFYTTPGNYTVQLIVTDSSGCFSPDSVSINVNIGDFQGGVVQPTQPICPGDTFALDAFGGTNYEWSPASVLNDPFVSNPVATIDTTTTFSVVISDSCGSDTLQLTLEVYSQTIDISNDTTICLGGSAPLFVTGPGSVSWTPPQSLNNPLSFTPLATPDTNTTYVATVVSPNNCIYIDTVTIGVNYNPPTPVLADTAGFCVGTQLQVFISGGDTYEWYPDDGFINPTTGPLITANPIIDSWYYCDVTNACGTTTDSIFIMIIDPQITAGNDTIVCPGEIANLWANGANFYQWTPSSKVIFASGNVAEVQTSTPTNFMVIGTDLIGCKDTAYVQVDVYPHPSIQASSDVIAFYGDQVQLTVTSQTNGVFTWSPPEFLSCINCDNPVANPDQNITYAVSIIDINGCTDEDFVNISYESIIYIPNTFVPDNSGPNQLFGVYGGNIESMQMLIFNRWGEIICTLNSINEFWDGTYKGKKCQDGTYVWKLIYKDFTQSAYQLTGHVNLIR